MRLSLETCPVCGRGVRVVEQAPLKVQQVAELVEQPIEIREYQRPKYGCEECGWSGYAPNLCGGIDLQSADFAFSASPKCISGSKKV